MKRFINIIEKSARIKNRFMNIIGRKFNPNRHKHHNHNQPNHQIDLDNHNDSSNWTYN